MRAIFSFNYNDILFIIISFLYPDLYHIMPLSYHDHQTDLCTSIKEMINCVNFDGKISIKIIKRQLL